MKTTVLFWMVAGQAKGSYNEFQNYIEIMNIDSRVLSWDNA
jgi:hypothetical protein